MRRRGARSLLSIKSLDNADGRTVGQLSSGAADLRYRPRAVVGQWLLSGDGFRLLQYGGSDLRLAKFLILFLKSAAPVLSDGGLSF